MQTIKKTLFLALSIFVILVVFAIVASKLLAAEPAPNAGVSGRKPFAFSTKVDPTGRFFEDELVVKFKENISEDSRQNMLSSHGISETINLPKTKVTIFKIEPTAREKVMEALKQNPNVEYVELNKVSR